MSNGEMSKVRGGKTWLVVVLIVVLVGVLALSFLYYSSQKKVVDMLQLNALQAQRLEEFGKLSDEVRMFNSRFGTRFGEIKVLAPADSVLSDISRIQGQNPPDAIDTLLTDFRSTAEKLAYLGDKIEKLEARLGSPYKVKANDSHAKLALDFLTKEAGLSPAEAQKVLKRTALIWELEPGNYVYNLYWKDIFLTTVTQGEAKRSPLVVQRRLRESTAQYIEELENQLRSLSLQDSLQTLQETSGQTK